MIANGDYLVLVVLSNFKVDTAYLQKVEGKEVGGGLEGFQYSAMRTETRV